MVAFIMLCIIWGWIVLALFFFIFYAMYLEIKDRKLDIEEKERKLRK